MNRRPRGHKNLSEGFCRREEFFAAARNRNTTFWLSKLYVVILLTELTLTLHQ